MPRSSNHLLSISFLPPSSNRRHLAKTTLTGGSPNTPTVRPRQHHLTQDAAEYFPRYQAPGSRAAQGLCWRTALKRQGPNKVWDFDMKGLGMLRAHILRNSLGLTPCALPEGAMCCLLFDRTCNERGRITSSTFLKLFGPLQFINMLVPKPPQLEHGAGVWNLGVR